MTTIQNIQNNRAMKFDALKGAVGISSVTLGSVLSLQNIEIWLRLTSLVVGISVGVVSFWSIVRKWKRR